MLGENLHSLENNSADRVVMSFLFHELPQIACRKILNEAWRVLSPGGTIHIIDMDHRNPRIKKLGSTSVGNWLMEPYMDSYLKMDIQAMLLRLNYTDVNRVTLESPAPIAGYTGRKPGI
jgi:ubiquinone/menaquinone biosynthesis C-methylase UbiE